MEPIPPQPGSPGDPRHFVGRARTTRIAEARLSVGTNLALTDPRRMGKSSWLEHFCATTQNFDTVYVDYQGVRTCEEFLVRTATHLGRARSVPSKAKSALASFFDNLGLQEVSAGPVKVKVGVHSMSPTALLSNTVLAVDEHAIARPVLVCMDEVPWAIRNIAQREGPQAASELLQTLRALRHEARQIRWIVCGSIGFHHVLRQCGATVGDINDLDSLPLGPLDPQEALELAERLLLGARLRATEAAVSALAERCGGIPFLLHKVASMLGDQARDGRVDAPEVEKAFLEFVDDRDESRAVTHLLERLDPNYGADAELARTILDTLAVSDTPVPYEDFERDGAQDRTREVVDFLLDDHYLLERGRVLCWRYDVLRFVWARRRRLSSPS